MPEIIHATDASFENDVINNSQTVLVDFWAEWCGPCKMISPVLDQLAEEYTDLQIAKVNVDDNSDTPAKFGVRGIPTLLLFKNGEIVGQKVGALSKTQLIEFIESASKQA